MGIIVKNLTVSYGQKGDSFTALEHISFDAPKGSVVAVIGPSGCGKSTLLRAIAGLETFEGSITIGGEAVNPKKQKIGFMQQNYGLLPWRTLRENILMAAKIRGEAQKGKKKFTPLTDELGLSRLLDRYPGELSGGEEQRGALARVFLLEPDVLLMDEPFSALDVITREKMQEVFLELWRTRKITTILVTHFVEEALYLGQRILLMSDGNGRGGRIESVFDNGFFGLKDIGGDEYFRMGQELRRQLGLFRERKA